MDPLVLHLTLSAIPYQVMVTGEKTQEFRKQSHWITSRLFRDGQVRPFTHVEFVNGYGKNKPRFIAEFKSIRVVTPGHEDFGKTLSYSNGLKVQINEPMYVIELGDIKL